MTFVRILKRMSGKFWNLKVGCVYRVNESNAKQMIEKGSAEPLIETAMAPSPKAEKHVRESNRTNAISSHPGRNEAAPKSDKRR